MSDLLKYSNRMLDQWELLQRDLEDRSNLVELARLRGLSVDELEQRIDTDLHTLNRIGARKGSIPTQRETVDLALKHTPQRT